MMRVSRRNQLLVSIAVQILWFLTTCRPKSYMLYGSSPKHSHSHRSLSQSDALPVLKTKEQLQYVPALPILLPLKMETK